MHYTDQSIEELTTRLHSLYTTKYAPAPDTNHPYALDIHHPTPRSWFHHHPHYTPTPRPGT